MSSDEELQLDLKTLRARVRLLESQVERLKRELKAVKAIAEQAHEKACGQQPR